jgi:hypothetical protein
MTSLATPLVKDEPVKAITMAADSTAVMNTANDHGAAGHRCAGNRGIEPELDALVVGGAGRYPPWA